MSVTREDLDIIIASAIAQTRDEAIRLRNAAVDSALADRAALTARVNGLEYGLAALVERIDALDANLQRYRDDKFTATRRMIVDILKEQGRG
jgi:vacuolar-type H+-ATPase subunit E/Vma4